MYEINGSNSIRIEEITFSDCGIKESDIEELLRKNIDMICDDEESLLLVGQQTENEAHARSDLIAIDQDGNLVLIELKRDIKDIQARKEALEFQAIRYAASCATIQSTDALIQNVFSRYVEKHRAEYGNDGLSSSEIAKRQLEDFLKTNHITSFNAHQRIILVASDFDEQTLSAVAWLNSNEVDISCFRLVPYMIGEKCYIMPQKLLPVPELEDYYIDMRARASLEKKPRRDIIRRSLPKIAALLEWDIVNEGDILVAKGRTEEARLNADGTVTVLPDLGTKPVTIQNWLKTVYGWSSVQTYAFAVQKSSGKTLSQLRDEYMEQTGLQARDDSGT